MKRLILVLVGILFLNTLDVTPAVSSATTLIEPARELVSVTKVVPTISARAYGVFDVETGEIIFAQNAEQRLPIASVTKLFTAAAALEQTVDQSVTVLASDVATEGRAGKLEAGQVYKAHELLFPLLLESSNDAAVALGRVVGPVSYPNVTLTDTSGLSSANQASVEELAQAVKKLYGEVPHIFDITQLPQYVGTYTGWVNNSPVRTLPGYQGGKHGYTEAAGRTLVALFSEPALGDRKLGYILLGSNDLLRDTVALRSAVAESISLE